MAGAVRYRSSRNSYIDELRFNYDRSHSREPVPRATPGLSPRPALVEYFLDPRGSGLLFFMFIRPHPYTCLGIEWLTQGGVECTIFHVYKAPPLHLFGN
jgi:hypothetical protein